MNITKKIYNNFSTELENIWNDFEKNSNNFCFQNFYWLKNWYFSLNENKKPDIYNVLIYKENKLIMILPLCVTSKNRTKYLMWQGGERSDYMTCLLAKDFFLEKKIFILIWNEVLKEIKNYDIIYFYRQPNKINDLDNPFVNYLPNKIDNTASSIILEENFNLFLKKNLKKKFIYDTERRIRNVKKIGDLEFKIYQNYTDDQINSKVKELLDYKIKRLKKQKLKNPFNDEAIKFYENFDNKYFENGSLHYSTLSINEKNISFHWGIVHKKIFYHLIPCVSDEEFFKYSPGRIHTLELVKWSINNKLKKFDFTIGDENYKKDWINQKELLFSYMKLCNFSSFWDYLCIYFKTNIKNLLIFKKIYKIIKSNVKKIY